MQKGCLMTQAAFVFLWCFLPSAPVDQALIAIETVEIDQSAVMPAA